MTTQRDIDNFTIGYLAAQLDGVQGKSADQWIKQAEDAANRVLKEIDNETDTHTGSKTTQENTARNDAEALKPQTVARDPRTD